MKAWRTGLSTRLAVVVATLVALAVVLAGTVLLRVAERDLLAAQDTQLRAAARIVAPFAERLRDGSVRPRIAVSVEQRAVRIGGGLRIRWPNGDEFAVGDIPDANSLPAATGRETVEYDGQRWRVLTTEMPDGRGLLWAATPLDETDAQLALLRRRIALIGVLAAVTAGAAGLLVGRWLTRPLRALQNRAAEISSGGDGSTWPVERMPGESGVAEVDDLAVALNGLLASRDADQRRTEVALRSARSFSATAAHELRTPMMSIQTNLDVLAAHGGLPTAERAEIIVELQSAHVRMQNVLGMLRALAQGELLDPASFTQVDLADIVDEAVDSARRRHATRIELVAPQELAVRGWPEGLRLICENLITNAIVHGTNGGSFVRVNLDRSERGDAVLTVDDLGPGLDPKQRSLAFERFQRRPGSPGVGLGLTVTAQQVRLHGGMIELTDNPLGRGTRAVVTLPAERPASPGDLETDAPVGRPEMSQDRGASQKTSKIRS
jgi:two-component system sensor histidine kinase PrrB